VNSVSLGLRFLVVRDQHGDELPLLLERLAAFRTMLNAAMLFDILII